MFARSVLAAVFISTLFIVPAAAAPAEKDTPAPTASPATQEHAHDGGIIAGRITSVDYRRNSMTVNRTAITVMPSTQIQGSDAGYHVITDLKPGMSVEVYTSLISGRYIAQIITLR